MDDSTRDLKIDGLFLAIGHVPNTAIFNGQLATTPEGYLLNRTALAWKGVEAPPGLIDTPAQLWHRDQRRGRLRAAATWSTPTIARPSPRRDRAARPPWIARSGSSRSIRRRHSLNDTLAHGFRLERPAGCTYHALRQRSSRHRNKRARCGRRHPPQLLANSRLQFLLRRSSGGECRAASGFGTTRVICRPGTE